VIANPPYVRQEKIAPQDIPEEEITKELRQEYKVALVRSVSSQWGDEFKKDLKSDLYVYFYYSGLSLLKPRGVFCFISSNSWLDVGFGAKLQAFLLRNIETKAIYDNHAKRTFAEADINTIIVVFKRPKEKVLTENLTRFVAFKKPFEVVIDEGNLKVIYNAKEKLKTDDFRCVTLTQGELWNEGVAGEDTKQAEITGSEFIGNYAGNKWGGKYLRAPDIFFTMLEKGKLRKLKDFAEVKAGCYAGIDDFFYLNSESRSHWQIEQEFLIPLIRKSQEVKHIEISPTTLDTTVLSCRLSKGDLERNNENRIFEYIQWGEKQVTRKRMKTPAGIPWPKVETVKNRKPGWWAIPEPNIRETNLFMIYRINDRFISPYSQSTILSDRCYHRIFPRKTTDTLLLCALLNVTLSALMIEIIGCSNLGQGALYFETTMARELLILNPDSFSEKLKENIIEKLRVLMKRKINSIFEECGIDPNKPITEQEPNPLSDRAELDNIIFDELGLIEEERKEVYWAVCELVKQRLEKARSLRK